MCFLALEQTHRYTQLCENTHLSKYSLGYVISKWTLNSWDGHVLVLKWQQPNIDTVVYVINVNKI